MRSLGTTRNRRKQRTSLILPLHSPPSGIPYYQSIVDPPTIGTSLSQILVHASIIIRLPALLSALKQAQVCFTCGPVRHAYSTTSKLENQIKIIRTFRPPERKMGKHILSPTESPQDSEQNTLACSTTSKIDNQIKIIKTFRPPRKERRPSTFRVLPNHLRTPNKSYKPHARPTQSAAILRASRVLLLTSFTTSKKRSPKNKLVSSMRSLRTSWDGDIPIRAGKSSTTCVQQRSTGTSSGSWRI